MNRIQIGRSTTKKGRVKKPTKRKPTEKDTVRKTVRNLEGAVVFVGTEMEWRRWARSRQ